MNIIQNITTDFFSSFFSQFRDKNNESGRENKKEHELELSNIEAEEPKPELSGIIKKFDKSGASTVGNL